MNKRNTEMKNAAVSDDLTLEIPNETHRQEYQRIMERWEQLEDNIQPELMRRGTTPYEKWLEYCECRWNLFSTFFFIIQYQAQSIRSHFHSFRKICSGRKASVNVWKSN